MRTWNAITRDMKREAAAFDARVRRASAAAQGGALRRAPRFSPPFRVRFWAIYRGSPVRLTLHQGKGLSWQFSHPTEEGYHEEGATYFLNGDTLTQEWWYDGRDCDGRMTREGECECRIDQLAAGYQEGEITWPKWEPVNSRQRDYAAEAAGY